MEFNKCVLLVRVDTSKVVANFYGPEGQTREPGPYVTEHGLSLNAEIDIVNTPLNKGDRPIDKLESYPGRQPDLRIVVALKTDCISMSVADFVALEGLIDKLDFKVHIVKEGQVLRKETMQQGRLVKSIFTLLASIHTVSFKEEVVKGQRIKAEKGAYPGQLLFSYRIDREHNAIVEEPTEAAIVKELFSECASGQASLRELHLKYDHPLGKHAHRSTLPKILSSPFYCGEFV